MNEPKPPATLRIGELSRRLGVSDHALRAWERRYGLLRPVRTAGGYRLYTEADVERVRRMQEHLAVGLSAAEAARAARAEDETAGAGRDGASVGREDTLTAVLETLTTAFDDFDEATANALIDRMLSTFTVETALREALLPYLRRLGERWAAGEVSVAQEHFASNVIRSRLSSMARGWGHGGRPRAVLACVPGELHDIALLAFGIVLHRRGWHIQFLGANTPIEDLVRLAATGHPDLIVLAATSPERFDVPTTDLARLAAAAPLALAGPGATRATADAVGARLLTGDPVSAAEDTARDPRAGALTRRRSTPPRRQGGA